MRFPLRAKASLGRFPVLAPDNRAPVPYFDLWSRTFEGIGRAATARWLTANGRPSPVERLVYRSSAMVSSSHGGDQLDTPY